MVFFIISVDMHRFVDLLEYAFTYTGLPLSTGVSLYIRCIDAGFTLSFCWYVQLSSFEFLWIYIQVVVDD